MFFLFELVALDLVFVFAEGARIGGRADEDFLDGVDLDGVFATKRLLIQFREWVMHKLDRDFSFRKFQSLSSRLSAHILGA